MTEATSLAALGRLLGDESRAAMCLAMLDGGVWTVTELAGVAGVSVATASEHVSKLVRARLATEERRGRNRCVRLRGSEVGQALESITSLTGPAPASGSLRAVGARRRLSAARTCYDHMAGRLGVAVCDALLDRGLLDDGAGLALTTRGQRWFEELDIDVAALRAQRRSFVRECVDWTERRPHLAGALGAALCGRFLDNQWVRRTDRTRRLEVTEEGRRAVRDLLGITADTLAVRAQA